MGGINFTPILANFAILFKCIAFKGVSLGTNIKFLFSLITTSAALLIKLSDIPLEIAAMVFILVGTIIIPFVLNVPLAIGE